ILKGKSVLLNMVQVKGEEHRPIIVILDDVTERKRIETQLQQARRMEAIGTLSGGIAHDFNNLLMGIQGNVSLMLLDVDPAHPHFEFLKKIERMVKSGSRLTSQLLGYAKKGKYEVKPTNLNHLVIETSEIFGRTRREVIINRNLADNLLLIEADQGQIEQVLLNLYVNAWQAMPEGGDLFIKTKNASHKEITSKLYKPQKGNYVALTIRDKGVGMDKKTQERIFDPFFTTKDMLRGTGLGLASAYGIIQNHGGHIEVESKKGKGTTFNIYFPASKKEIQEEVEASEEIAIGKEMILLVDDEEMILETEEQILKILGYKVVTARNGKAALKIYKKYKDEIELVILDMIMPSSGGREAYDNIMEINPGAKILLASGYSIDGQAGQILKKGYDGFIQKPFNIMELSMKIREILDKP
ncbi:ATP-binding protein, partial [Thermodesulfobacteriota bacterium]